MKRSDRKIYKGESLRCVAMPLGGIGAGSIAIAGDGSLRQWQIFNNVNHLCEIPADIIILTKKRGEEPEVRPLRLAHDWYDSEKDEIFAPAASVSDHVVPDMVVFGAGDEIADVSFAGEYPLAELVFRDAQIPVEVILEAFSPFVPLRAEMSGFPAVLLTFTVRNVTNSETDVTLCAALLNAVGYDGVAPVFFGDCADCWGGNINRAQRRRGLSSVEMTNPSVPVGSGRWGTMSLALAEETAVIRHYCDDTEAAQLSLTHTGTLRTPRRTEATPPGKSTHGVIALPFTLPPGGHKKTAFVIAWHFPNRYVNWNQEGFGVKDKKSRLYIGNMYNNWFSCSQEVVEAIRDDFDRLVYLTRLFRDTFYDSTLPYTLLDCVTSQISTIRSPTCFWTEDGRLYGFEGCRGASTGDMHATGGCCPLNCTHVWNYEQSLSKLFPDLERTMRQTDLDDQMTPEGGIPHRTVLPLYVKRWHSDDPESEVYACDGHFGTVLKVYREYLVCGDRKWLDWAWPKVKLAIEFAFRRWDSDGDGVCSGPQWNTYDLNFHGANTFIGTFYLAALRAAEEMALIQGDKDLAKEYRRRFERGRDYISRELWNGEYYEQKYDARKYKERQYGSGCLSDQVIGQWWAHILGLGYILPEDQVKKALKSVMKYNFKRDFKGFKQQPRVFASEHDSGLLTCTWPKGGRPREPMYYCDEIWTGIEYQVAAHMIFEGMVTDGLKIVEAARARYDGRYRNPWNEVECGDHYVRPMSSWSLLEAISGFRWDGHRKCIHFGPKATPRDFRCFFITDTAWGSASQLVKGGRQTIRLHVKYGKLKVRHLEVKSAIRAPKATARAKAGGRELPCKAALSDGRILLDLGQVRAIPEGALLDVEIR